MRAIKKARRFIESHPEDPASATLSKLVIALESEQPFALAELYQLPYSQFETALEVLAEWRLDRYYSGKARLLGASVQVASMREAAPAAPKPPTGR